MFMCFCGGGIGHLGSTLDATCVFERLNDVLESSGESNQPEDWYEKEDSKDGEEEQDLEEDEEESSSEIDENELGPEDGEDDTDEEDYQGFAKY